MDTITPDPTVEPSGETAPIETPVESTLEIAPTLEAPAETIVEPTSTEEATAMPEPVGEIVHTRTYCRVCAKDLFIVAGTDPLCVHCGGTAG